MIAFYIFWNNTEVARIYKNGDKYKYLPNNEEIKLQKDVPEELKKPQLRWGSMPKYFQEKINNPSRFEGKLYIRERT